MQTLKKILFFLSSQERKRAALLLVMMVIMALLDMIGVASILPFIAVLANPNLIETNEIQSASAHSAGPLGSCTAGLRPFCYRLSFGGLVVLTFGR